MYLLSQPFKTKYGDYVFVRTNYVLHYGCFCTKVIEYNDKPNTIYHFSTICYEEKYALSEDDAKKNHEQMIEKYKSNEDKEVKSNEYL